MLRSLLRFTLFSSTVLGLLALSVPARAQTAPPGAKVKCTWGQPQKMAAIPGCGVPVQLSVAAPPGAERMMFARDDNPTLKRYMYRARAIGAPVKSFKRMINVTKTDLVVCPSDFQKARILSFRVLRRRAIVSRPTCELGPPGSAMAPTLGAAMSPAMTPGMTAKAPGMTARPGMAGMGSVTQTIERDNPVRQRDLVKLRRAIKMDSLARLLGLLGLLLGLGAAVGVVLLALSVRKRLSKLERARESTDDG